MKAMDETRLRTFMAKVEQPGDYSYYTDRWEKRVVTINRDLGLVVLSKGLWSLPVAGCQYSFKQKKFIDSKPELWPKQLMPQIKEMSPGYDQQTWALHNNLEALSGTGREVRKGKLNLGPYVKLPHIHDGRRWSGTALKLIKRLKVDYWLASGKSSNPDGVGNGNCQMVELLSDTLSYGILEIKWFPVATVTKEFENGEG